METAVETGYEDSGAEESGFLQQLRSNTEVFSAFKAHRMGRDMASQMIDDDGKLKSFRQFKKDTEKIVSHHVNSWLRTEYDTAIRRAHRAAEMRQFREEADVFPNIEWLPSTAVTPREAHKPFYHHIWPIDDPFWESHKPGDEWGCQCHWQSTDEPPTDNSGLDDGVAPPSKGLGGDPSKTGQVFTDDHPYFPKDCAHCGFYNPGIKDRLRYLFLDRKKACYACPYIRECINELKSKERRKRNKALYESLKADPNYKDVKFDKKSGGVMASHIGHNFDKKGGLYELEAQKCGFKLGHAVILENERNGKVGQKFTEGIWDGLRFEVAGRETATENNILKGLKHCAEKRMTEIAVLVYPNGGFDEDILKKAIRRYLGLKNLQGSQFVPFTRILCIQDGKIVFDSTL